MEKKTTNEQLYIVSLDNGIREEEPVTIEVYNTFSDGSELVQLNNTVFGVLKKNSLNPETMYIDDFNIIKADIAELIDVDHEETKRIVDENQNIGVFTTLNYSKDIETRISATTAINHIISYVNNGVITGEEAETLSKVLKISTATPISNKEEVRQIVDLGITILKKEVELQSGLSFDAKLYEAVRKRYLRMIIFDILVGRKNRDLDYYLISKINEQGKPVWVDSYLSPISVASMVDKEKSVPEGAYCINNKVVNTNVLLEVLYEYYYDEIKKLTVALNDAKGLYQDAISRIVYNNTDLDNGSKLEAIINKNLDLITKKEEVKEKSLDKEQKMNKVERTMATQSLNVRVTTKLDLIQKKYPINPKEHPEIFAKKDKLDKEDIKLIVEDEKKKNGFVSSVILISVISLVCGIGAGIAYVLMTFGN
ncbi:MAG: hypothetical protein IKP07_03250 [Bacilli bacterium]|nr:hypothetical protein [Bacilli bacterium]